MVREDFYGVYKIQIGALPLTDIVRVVEALDVFDEVCLLLGCHAVDEVAHEAEGEEAEEADEDCDVCY